jgi:hypothetical protein
VWSESGSESVCGQSCLCVESGLCVEFGSVCGLSLGQSCLCVESGSFMSVIEEETGLGCRQMDHTLKQTSSREEQLRCSTKSLLQTPIAQVCRDGSGSLFSISLAMINSQLLYL